MNYRLILTLGFINLFVPFLGIPSFFRNWIIAISSLILISYAFYLRSVSRRENMDEKDAPIIDSKQESSTYDVEKKQQREELEEQVEDFENNLMEDTDE